MLIVDVPQELVHTTLLKFLVYGLKGVLFILIETKTNLAISGGDIHCQTLLVNPYGLNIHPLTIKDEVRNVLCKVIGLMVKIQYFLLKE